MIKYQNISQTLNKSSFIEIGEYTGDELTFTAKRPKVNVGGQEVVFAKGSIALRSPHEVTSCDEANGCVLGTVTESVTLDFNVVGIDSLDVLKAEIDRVFALVKTSMTHGVLPPVYSDFVSE